MPLSTWGRMGAAAGGVSNGLSLGARRIAEEQEAQNAQKRTALMEQDIGLRTKEAQRKEEEYQRGMEPISLEDARKTFAEPEIADYHEGFARSIGAIRKNEDGSEYIIRKDARDIAILMKSPELQKDMNDYQVTTLREKLMKAEKDAEAQPELKAEAEKVRQRLDVAEARNQGLVSQKIEAAKERSKITVVPEGSRVFQGGKEVAEATAKTPKTLNEMLAREVSEGRMTLDEALAKNKKGGEGSGLVDAIREERLQMAKDKEEREKRDEQYRRQERVDKEWDKDENRYKQQYQADLEQYGETVARENWNNNVAAMRKKFKPRYAAIGLDLEGNPLEKGKKEGALQRTASPASSNQPQRTMYDLYQVVSKAGSSSKAVAELGKLGYGEKQARDIIKRGMSEGYVK